MSAWQVPRGDRWPKGLRLVRNGIAWDYSDYELTCQIRTGSLRTSNVASAIAATLTVNRDLPTSGLVTLELAAADSAAMPAGPYLIDVRAEAAADATDVFRAVSVRPFVVSPSITQDVA